MREPKEIVLHYFLSKLPSEKANRLLQFLPEKKRHAIEQAPAAAPSHKIGPMLDLVHWSWFIPTLKTYSAKEQRLFLSSLPELAAKNLSQELNLSPEAVDAPIRPIAAAYLREVLLSSLTGTQRRPLPPTFLPPTPLKGLLALSKKELTHFIDLLALCDLAVEIRQIVETKILKRIYSFLSEEEREILKAAQPEAYPLPRLNLEQWEGDEESFRHLLHRRGLTRLGLALSGQDPDLIWYLCHQLDIGRGNALFKLCAKEETAGVSEQIIRQIEGLL